MAAQTLPHQPTVTTMKRPGTDISPQSMNYPAPMGTYKPPTATSSSSGKSSFSFGQVCQRPLHPKYTEESTRLDSFIGWPTNKTQKPDAMAKAGFFYAGMKDCVKCYFCNGGLWNWYPGDDPWTEHKRWFPKCGFIQLFKTLSLKKHKTTADMPKKRNDPETDDRNTEPPKPTDINERLKAYMRTPTVQAVIGMSMFDSTKIEYVCKKKLEAGSEFADAGSLIDEIFKIEGEGTDNPEQSSNDSLDDNEDDDDNDEDTSSSGPAEALGCQSAGFSGSSLMQPQFEASAADNSESYIAKKRKKNKKKKKKTPTSPQINTTNEEDLKQKLEKIEQEKHRLRDEQKQLLDARTCKICMDKPKTTVFLPCGHLTACEDCAEALRNCPLCRTRINGTVKTFLS